MKIKIEMEVDFLDLDERRTFETLKEVEDYFSGYEKDEEFEKCKKCIEDGGVVHAFRISNDDRCNPIGRFLYDEGLRSIKFPKNVKLVTEEQE